MNEILETSPSKDECNLGMLAHLLGIFSGFVGALILWLVRRDDPGFATEQAKEALNFQITMALAFIAAILLKVILIGMLLVPILLVVNFVFSILGAIAASKGQRYRYPFAIRLVS